MKILFVCTGNTCRSPMAEALIKHKMPDAAVRSAGIFAASDGKANRHALEALKEYGVTLDHRSQPITDTLLNWADLVLTMTTDHKQSLILQYPHFQDKYFTLKEYVSESDRKIWSELKQLHAKFEEKRARFIQQNEHKFSDKQLEEMLARHLQDDIEKIRELEAGLINYNVSDPFGGSLEIYQQTLAELHHYTDLLIDKINK